MRVGRNILRYVGDVVTKLGLENTRPFSYIFKVQYLAFKSSSKDRFRKTKVMGQEFWIDTEDRSISLELWKKGFYEKGTTPLVKKLVGKGDFVLDIGANIGYYTKIFSKLVGDNGHVYAFEPDPTNQKLLKKNAPFPNVTLVDKAIANTKGTSSLYLDPNYKGGHTLIEKNDKAKSIEVKTTSLDKYFNQRDEEIDFVKIDIEGQNYRLLKEEKRY